MSVPPGWHHKEHWAAQKFGISHPSEFNTMCRRLCTHVSTVIELVENSDDVPAPHSVWMAVNWLIQLHMDGLLSLNRCACCCCCCVHPLWAAVVGHSYEWLQVTHVCLVLVCSDFIPHLYASLSHILLSRFTETSSPVTLLEVFLKLMTHGQCHSVDNGTVSTRDYDVKHWALSQSRVKGRHSSFGWFAGTVH